MTENAPTGGFLRQLSDQLAEAVTQAATSIVHVSARPRYGASGVIWADGIVVTADHVVEQEDGITVTLHNGQAHNASLAGRDPETDLAVLRVPGLVGQAIGRGAAPRVGNLALLVARPGASEQAGLAAIRSISDARGRGRRAQPLPLIGVDLIFHPGFSGGGLVDVDGGLLGIATSGFGRGRGGGVVIGRARVEQVVDSLVQHGRVRRGYLGITSQPVEIPTAMRAAAGSEQTRGLLVLDVAQGSPAERGGMLMGDILISIAEESVQGPRDLRAQLTAERVGQAVPVTVLRGGQAQTLSVTVGEQV
jgi:S1-C subfamily serine protease